MNYTEEQQRVVESQARFLRVNAFAGAGKTTVLRGYARARPQQRMLYIAFNKAIQEEAAKAFPKNVECRTVHSVAYRAVGHRYRAKLAARLRPADITHRFGVSYPEANSVLAVLGNYLASSDREMGAGHFPASLLPMDDRRGSQRLLRTAQDVWAAMCDVDDSATPMLHDGYLKVFQLGNPVLPYDRLLLDEAQDTNEVSASIFVNQKGDKILVGDTYQQIYAFRGAVNAMTTLGHLADETLYLTGSFRFSPEIAEYANRLLRLRGEKRKIQGFGPKASLSGHAVLSRTNATLFSEAVALHKEFRIHFVGGWPERFDEILSVFGVSTGQPELVRHAHLKRFRSAGQIEEYAHQADDIEMKMMLKVVAEYGAALPGLMDKIRRAHCAQADGAVCLSTAHRSKGLEWAQVLLTDDFLQNVELKPKTEAERAKLNEELNLAYVAVTRAARRVELAPTLEALLGDVSGKGGKDPGAGKGRSGRASR